MYDLMVGNFPVDDLADKKTPFLEGYYAFYLYNGSYTLIPDIADLGSAPFMRSKYVHPEDPSITSTNRTPRSYLLNDSTRGWTLPSNRVMADLPFMSKIISVGFDVVTFEKNKDTFVFNFDLAEIDFYDNDEEMFFALKLSISINLTRNPITGKMDGNMQFFVLGYVKGQSGFTEKDSISQPIQGGLISNYTDPGDDHFLRNETEDNLGLKSLVRSMSIVFRVRFRNSSGRL